jgi:hypothetical protein
MAEHVPLVEQAALQVLSCGRLVVDCDTQVCINLESIAFFKGRCHIRPEISGQLSLCIFDACLSFLRKSAVVAFTSQFKHFHLLNGPTLQGYCVELIDPPSSEQSITFTRSS